MYYDITIQTREEFLRLANKIGEVLHSTHSERPWIIAMGGEGDSGKSLIALGIDEIFNPGLYPNGITKQCSADYVLNDHIVFRNFRRVVKLDRKDFDETSPLHNPRIFG